MVQAKRETATTRQATALASKPALLDEFGQRLRRGLGTPLRPQQSHDEWDEADQLVPNARLRLAMLTDPSLAAIIAESGCLFAPGDFADAPFRLAPRNVVMLPAALKQDSAALAVAARWAVEAKQLTANGATEAALMRSTAFAVALLDLLPPESAGYFLNVVPEEFRHVLSVYSDPPPAAFFIWLAGLLDAEIPAAASEKFSVAEFDLPLETVMVGGGDSRLTIAEDTRRNRYGVPPHPRPSAIHFSSSTASAVSDHGFMLCEQLRRQLQVARDRDGATPTGLRQTLLDNIADELRGLLGLTPDDASICLSSSGTDTELMAVLLASLSAQSRKIENILIAPDESGRGVRLAAAGQFFDTETATGHSVTKGGLAWAAEPVAVHDIEIRKPTGEPRPAAEIGSELLATGKAILARGNAIVTHVLLASKTGLLAPDYEDVEKLVALAPDRVMVIVDACQMRVPYEHLGDLVRKGWLVQISGSKFLTGPPFSGALGVPAHLRQHAAALAEALASAPAVGHPEDWDSQWQSKAVASRVATATSGFGPLFRWVPAIAEAQLFRALDEPSKAGSFERFRNEILNRITYSHALQPISGERYFVPEGNRSFMTNTILSFQVLANDGKGGRVALAEPECRKIFEFLNEDMQYRLPHLSPLQKDIASLEAHLGQPVALGTPDDGICVLRMVLGARFFNFIGHSPPQSQEAALMSEIEDAKRAISKLELLAEHWPTLKDIGP